MKLIPFLLIFFVSLSIHAQPEGAHYSGDEFRANETYYTFGNNVNLREEPNTDSDTVIVLTINTSVTLLEISGESISIDGHDSKWLLVKIDEQIQGYIPATFVATGRIYLDNPGEYLLYKKREKEWDGTLYLRSTISQNNYKDLGSLKLANNNFSMTLFDNRGLSGIDHLIEVNYLAESCGEESGTQFITFAKANGQITDLGLYSSVGDGGVYHKSETLIFPTDKDGMKDMIIHKGEEGAFTDEEETEYRTIQKEANYAWKDGKLERSIKQFEYK
ncbi:SH3 domain-containing protein [Nonlabens ulvanivorans]|uniref:SH3 domain-containing protein n=1 Tax=Nonlabens ulvanivorans TaxID=906888 RepID=UPI00294399DC|nr:SH3 domain-containing protein [Nonlabens ulvanivorans]WOI22484.1 SH3 domain-containing protein [Nonlabens ulvanivorans]